MKKQTSKMKRAVIVGSGVLLCLMVAGCDASVSAMREQAKGITDPTERGCMYIAVALIIQAIIRGFMNK